MKLFVVVVKTASVKNLFHLSLSKLEWGRNAVCVIKAKDYKEMFVKLRSILPRREAGKELLKALKRDKKKFFELYIHEVQKSEDLFEIGLLTNEKNLSNPSMFLFKR